MQLEFTTKPPQLISTVDMKTYLKVEHSVDDNYITSLIKSAVSYCERYTNRCFLERSLNVVYRQVKNCYLYFPIIPVKSGTVVVNYFTNGSLVVLPTSNYVINAIGGYVIIKTFPTVTTAIDYWQIDYTAGVAVVADVEDCVIQAVYNIVADHYHNRMDGVRNLTSASQRLLNPIRNIVFNNG